MPAAAPSFREGLTPPPSLSAFQALVYTHRPRGNLLDASSAGLTQ